MRGQKFGVHNCDAVACTVLIEHKRMILQSRVQEGKKSLAVSCSWTCWGPQEIHQILTWTEISVCLISCILTPNGLFDELRAAIMHSRKIWSPLQLELPIAVTLLLTMLRCRKISSTLNVSTLWNWFQYGHEWCHRCSPTSQLEWKSDSDVMLWCCDVASDDV